MFASKFSKDTAVVTGGAGFLGSHLCDRLLAEGLRVIAIDNLITGSPDNVAHLAGNPDFRFIRQNVSEFIFVPGKVDYVFHFASPANPIGPRGVYDEAKRFAEAMTMAYHRFHGMDTKIVRIFNTYGPRMRLRDGRVVPSFISQALNNEPLTVFGDGSQTRSFCYVSDLIEGIFRLAMSKNHGPINIGNPVEMTIKQFAEKILEITGATGGITYRELPIDDPKVRQPDITRARTLLGWEPKIDFDKGIRITIDYFRTKLGR